MVNRQHVVVAYDVASNRRRRQVRRVLEQWRIGGQKSVHECLLSYREAESLFVELCELINPMEDKLLLIFVRKAVVQSRNIGENPFIYMKSKSDGQK